MRRSTDVPHRAAIYARQSITAEGSASLSIQVEICRATAARFDLEVVAELVEPPSTSGFKNRGRDRPKFNELLELIGRGVVDVVVIYNTDRLSRGGGVGWTPLLEAIEAAGHDPNRFILRPDGWLSEFELGIRATIDREESAKISARMLDVRAREARDGKPRPAICRPYGYQYSKDTKTMTMVVAEAETIRECAERVLSGETPYSVAKDLNRRGIPSATGKSWTTKVLLAVLRSPRIAGLRAHLGEIVAAGQWEPIITEDEHHRLVAVTANRHTHGPKRAPRTFPLIGFLACGKCGKPLRSVARCDRQHRGRRYACRSSENFGGCGGIAIKAERVENAVRDYIVGALTDPDARQAILAAAPAPDDRRQQALLAELRQLDLARQRLTDLAVDGTITATEVRRKTSELNATVERLQRELAATPAVAAATTLPLTHDELAQAWDERGIDFQRLLIGLLVESITVNPATNKNPRVFDRDRLDWSLRV